MSHHEKCGPQEVFLGNTERVNGLGRYTEKGLTTIRLGELAYDIEGKKLSEHYAPIFIHRSEEGRYDEIMMGRAFGANWRRG
jgi:hypothetical protein